MDRSDSDSYLDRQAAGNAAIRDAAARDANSWMRTWGWVTTILFWPVGLVLAIVLLTRGDRRHGGWMLGVCVALAIFAAFVFIPGTTDSGTSAASDECLMFYETGNEICGEDARAYCDTQAVMHDEIARGKRDGHEVDPIVLDQWVRMEESCASVGYEFSVSLKP